MKQFYAYIHAKPDGTPFYVGKGNGTRAHRLSGRNSYHARTVAKYGKQNILIGKLDCSSEEISFNLEIGLIKCLKRMGVSLANMTDGGEGPSGRTITDEHKAKISAANTNPSAETRAKMSEASRNKSPEVIERLRLACVGRIHSAETREKMSITRMGRVPTAETIEKLRAASTGQICSEEKRAKLRAANLGKKMPDSVKEMMSALHKGKELSIEHCDKISAGNKGKKKSEEHCVALSLAHKGKPWSDLRRQRHLEKRNLSTLTSETTSI